jgi:DNA-binding MarR family transcriptional regulator
MADICESTANAGGRNKAQEPPAQSWPREEQALADDPLWFIEAMFLAYRQFVSEPDRILAQIGFGRAHHRVIYFVHRYPGMRVADLLEILQITKQSLARVLRELVREGYVQRLSGKTDRRERLLYPTDQGRALAMRLTELQSRTMREALAAVGADGAGSVASFLRHMAPDEVQPTVLRRGRARQEAGGQETSGEE